MRGDNNLRGNKWYARDISTVEIECILERG